MPVAASGMRVGLATGSSWPWAELVPFWEWGESLGYDSLWMTDHIALPVDLQTRYPYREDGKFFWPPETPYLDLVGVLVAR